MSLNLPATRPPAHVSEKRRQLVALVRDGQSVSAAARAVNITQATACYHLGLARRDDPALDATLAARRLHYSGRAGGVFPGGPDDDDRLALRKAVDMTLALQPRFTQDALMQRLPAAMAGRRLPAIRRAQDRGWLHMAPTDRTQAPLLCVTAAGFTADGRRPLWIGPDE